MSSKTITELPMLTTAELTDYVIIEHTDSSSVTETYKITVENLLLVGTPKASGAVAVWDSPSKTIQITAENLLPNSSVRVDDIYYSFISYSYSDTLGTVTISIEAGLEVGSHTVAIENGIHSYTTTFTVE